MSQFLQTVGALAIFAALIVGLAFLAAWLIRRQEQAEIVKKVEAWRRDRPRAPLHGFLLGVQMQSGAAGAVGVAVAIPIFEPGSAARPADVDPLTGERIQYGWADGELREAWERPTEFIVE